MLNLGFLSLWTEQNYTIFTAPETNSTLTYSLCYINETGFTTILRRTFDNPREIGL